MKKALLNTKQFLITLSCISFFMLGTFQVFAQGPPEITVSSTCVLIGETIDFNFIDTSSDNPIIAYLWSFGDGKNGSGTTVSHTYINPGIHTVTVVFFDYTGQASSSEIEIEVKVPCGNYEIELPPSGDLTIQLGSTLNELTLEVSTNKEICFRFNTENIRGDITKIELELLYEGMTSESGTIQVYEGSTNTWNGSNIISTNKPQKEMLLGEQNRAYQLGELVRWELNTTEKKELLLILSTDSDKTFIFDADMPRLIVHVNNDDPDCNDDCNELPPSSISVSDDCLEFPATATFSSSFSTTNPTGNHFWNFGDGTTASGNTVTHTYYKAGIYTASYIAVDINGEAYSENISIVVNAPCGKYETNIPAKADFIVAGNTILNEATLQIGNGKESYLKFDTRDIIGAINKLELELSYEGFSAASGNIKIYKATHSDWTAETITAENKPSKKVLLAQQSGTYQLGDLIRFELNEKYKEEFKQKEEFTLIITTDGEELTFGSKEYYFDDGKPKLITQVNNSACIRFPCPGEENGPAIHFDSDEISTISSSQNSFISYPNPFTTAITLDLNFETEKVNVRIFDAVGKMVEQRANVHGKEHLQLGNNWANGIYFVHIQAGEEVFQKKLYKLER